jgi:hypothetical protein
MLLLNRIDKASESPSGDCDGVKIWVADPFRASELQIRKSVLKGKFNDPIWNILGNPWYEQRLKSMYPY